MKRLFLTMIAAGGLLLLTGGAASAFEPHYHGGGYHAHRYQTNYGPGGYAPSQVVVPHRGHYDILTPHGNHVDRTHVASPRATYYRQPVYNYNYSQPRTNFYYSNPNLSFGFGF